MQVRCAPGHAVKPLPGGPPERELHGEQGPIASERCAHGRVVIKEAVQFVLFREHRVPVTLYLVEEEHTPPIVGIADIGPQVDEEVAYAGEMGAALEVA